MAESLYPPVTETLRSDSDVGAFVGARIWRKGRAPQKPTRPYVVWFLVVGVPENTLSEPPGIDKCTVQIDVYDEDDKQSERIALAVRDAVESVAHCTSIPIDGREEVSKLYRIGMQFDWFFNR